MSRAPRAKTPRANAVRTKAMSLEQLDHWLRHEVELRWKNIGVCELDGFLTALVVGPTFIPPERWLQAIFGGVIPGMHGEPQGEAALQAIIERYNTISTTLAERPLDFGPILIREDDGTVVPHHWADGFWQGMRLNLRDWAPLMAPDKWMLLLPIMIYCLDRFGITDKDLPPHVVDDLATDGYHHIPEALAAIRSFLMPIRNASL